MYLGVECRHLLSDDFNDITGIIDTCLTFHFNIIIVVIKRAKFLLAINRRANFGIVLRLIHAWEATYIGRAYSLVEALEDFSRLLRLAQY